MDGVKVGELRLKDNPLRFCHDGLCDLLKNVPNGVEAPEEDILGVPGALIPVLEDDYTTSTPKIVRAIEQTDQLLKE